MTRYSGPDRSFGEHDDYAIGDIVHTYDNTEGTVTKVETSTYAETVYHVTGGEQSVTRTYDGSRLALVRRAPDPATVDALVHLHGEEDARAILAARARDLAATYHDPAEGAAAVRAVHGPDAVPSWEDAETATVWVSIGRNVSADRVRPSGPGPVQSPSGFVAGLRGAFVEYVGETPQLTTRAWETFGLTVVDTLIAAGTILGSFGGFGHWEDEDEESAAWVVSVETSELVALRRALGELAAEYGQDAVGFTAAPSWSTVTSVAR